MTKCISQVPHSPSLHLPFDVVNSDGIGVSVTWAYGHSNYTAVFLRENMERREFVAGIGGLAASGWIEVGDENAENEEVRTDEILAHETVQDTTHVPVRLKEGASVTVEINVKEGSGFSVAVMSLNGMEEKTVEEEDALVAEIKEDGEYLVDVSGDGTAEVRVVRS